MPADSPTHDLVFLGRKKVDLSFHVGGWPAPTEIHVDRQVIASCSCGYRRACDLSDGLVVGMVHVDEEHALRLVEADHRGHAWAEQRRAEIASLQRGNACRYCFLPLDDPTPLYCSESCERADRRRPDPEAVTAVLAGAERRPRAHRPEC